MEHYLWIRSGEDGGPSVDDVRSPGVSTSDGDHTTGGQNCEFGVHMCEIFFDGLIHFLIM